jgi:hypothetical protein
MQGVSIMSQQPRHRVRGWRPFALAAALLLGGALAAPARAAEGGPTDHALALVPADAAFYSASLRNREQLDALLKSKAWARVKELPLVQMGWKHLQEQWAQEGGPLEGLRQFYDQAENRELVAVLADAVSQEIFCYGGGAWADVTELALQLNNAVQYAPLQAQLEGKNPNEAQGRAALRALARNPNLVKVPELVLGFKVREPKKAESQINRLEALLKELIKQAPPLEGRLRRAKVGGHTFLTLDLDGSLVPWDQIPFKDFEDKPGEFDPLVKKLKGLKLSVSLGVRDGYLLLAVGPSAASLARLGGKGERLVDRPELNPLRKFAGKRLTSVGYVSKAFKARLQQANVGNLDGMVRMAQALLAKAGLPEDKRKLIEKDLTDLAGDVKTAIPEAGASVGFTFWTERGFESYAYDYNKYTHREGSRPLTLLDHVGGDPILAVVGRAKYDPVDYLKLVRWIQKAYGHADELLKDKLDDEQRKKYEEVSKAFLPLLKRLDQATGKLLAALGGDGQWALVLDARWTSRQWIDKLPGTDKLLPMLEPALVWGVGDAAELRKALAEYRAIANEMIAKVRELAPPGEVPDFQIPEPKVEKRKAGTLYSFPLPADWGLDKQVVPTGGLSAKVGVLTLSHAQAERLLTARPLKTGGGPLADRNRPLVSAAYCNWPAFVDALAPWVELAIQQTPLPFQGSDPDSDEGKKARADVLKQARTVLQVLKAFRGITSASYVEDGVLVTHSESVYQDL